MLNAFRAGGWGMLPTTVVGLLLIVVAVLYAIRPERRRLPLVLSLSLLTLLCGCLGFLSGVISTLRMAADGELDKPASVIVMSGTSESLFNLLLALAILALAMIIVADGALRIWRGSVG